MDLGPALRSEPSLAAELFDLGLLLQEVQDGRDVGVVDITMGDAHLSPLIPQHRGHVTHDRADRLAKQ